MIDWLSMIVPLAHPSPIFGGHVTSSNADSEVEWKAVKRRSVLGSFDSSLQVRTCNTPEPCTHVEISGNPVKFFQGHNLFGTHDLPSLARATVESLLGRSDFVLSPTRYDLGQWAAGNIRLTRVDVTESFHLNSLAEVLALIRSAEQTAHLSHRGRGQLVKGSTLYFGKRSRRLSLKLYAKGQEVRAKGHGNDMVLTNDHAMEFADRSLRVELTLRTMELKRRGLDYVRDWSTSSGVGLAVTDELLADVLRGMTMTTTATLADDVLASLPSSIQMAFQTWSAGVDLRSMLPRRTFYRYRSLLLPHGVDIATAVPREVSTVVPLHRVLEAKVAGIPDWARGTHWYYEPRRVA